MGATSTVRRLWRLIPAYRALEAELAECASARIQAEDARRNSNYDASVALEDRDCARKELSTALKQIANFEALRSGPIVPFPDVYQPMPMPEQELTVEERSPVLPRTMREYEQAARAVSRKAAEERRRGLFQALDAVTEN